MSEESSSKEGIIVVSKLKKTIKDACGMSSSQCLVDALNEKMHKIIAEATEHAKSSGRKTVMGRDVQ